MRTSPVLAALLCLSSVAAAQQPSVPPSAISVSASGEGRVVPDRAYVTVGVTTRAATAAAAAQENSRKQRAILDTLRAIGLRSDQLVTSGFNVSPEMRYDQRTGESSVIGYVVRNTVRAEIRRIDQVGQVIDAALKKGSNEIQGVAFFSSVADSVRREALASAVQLARADAEVLARAAGGTLGELLELSSSSMGRPIPMEREFRGIAGLAKAEVAAAPPIEPGEQVVQAMVSARWRFIPR